MGGYFEVVCWVCQKHVSSFRVSVFNEESSRYNVCWDCLEKMGEIQITFWEMWMKPPPVLAQFGIIRDPSLVNW